MTKSEIFLVSFQKEKEEEEDKKREQPYTLKSLGDSLERTKVDSQIYR